MPDAKEVLNNALPLRLFSSEWSIFEKMVAFWQDFSHFFLFLRPFSEKRAQVSSGRSQ
jgi:hypothetical protein